MSFIGTISRDFPPGFGNPRNSEGAFYQVSSTETHFYFTHYTGNSYLDNAVASIYVTVSADGGLSWQDPHPVFQPEETGAKNIMSVSCLRMENGDLGIFYLIRYSWTEIRLYLRRSSDGSKTFTHPICCVTHPGYHCTHNDRVIRLQSGRIIVPTSLAGRREEDETSVSSFNETQRCCFFYSDDDGASFREADNSVTLFSRHSKSGLQEPGVIELAPNLCYGWARTDLGRQYEMYSRDGGKSWSQAEPSPFTGPCSPLSMKRCPDGRLLAVWNPIPNYETRPIGNPGWGRTRLVYAISTDNGVTWGEPRILEDDNHSGFCYTAIHFTDSALLLAYCAGGEADKICLSRLRIRHIPLELL